MCGMAPARNHDRGSCAQQPGGFIEPGLRSDGVVFAAYQHDWGRDVRQLRFDGISQHVMELGDEPATHAQIILDHLWDQRGAFKDAAHGEAATLLQYAACCRIGYWSDQDQPADPSGMAKCKLDGNLAAHRVANQAGPRDACAIHPVDQCLCESGDVRLDFRCVAQAMPWKVGNVHVEFRGQPLCRRDEIGAGHAQAVDHHYRQRRQAGSGGGNAGMHLLAVDGRSKALQFADLAMLQLASAMMTATGVVQRQRGTRAKQGIKRPSPVN
jgi:hypothetical protein